MKNLFVFNFFSPTTCNDHTPQIPKGQNASRFRKRLNGYGQQEYPVSLELMAVKKSAGVLNSVLQGAGNTSVVRPSWSGEKEGGEPSPPLTSLRSPSEVHAAEG